MNIIFMTMNELRAEDLPFVQRTVKVLNPYGLHMRPASVFVKVAMKLKSTVQIRKNEKVVNGKSLMSMITLAAQQGTELELMVHGEDALQAIDILATILGSPSAEGLENLLLPKSS